MGKPMKMKAYASFALWAADRTPKQKKLVAALKKVVKKAGPKLDEIVKWGNGCFALDDTPVVYLYSDVDHIQFGFFAGAKLEDPKELLQGSGKFVRHVKVYTPKDIDAAYFTKLVKQAVKLAS